MKLFHLILCPSLIVLLGIAISARADDELPLTKTTVQSVVAFKNGFGFVMKTGKAQLKDNWTVIEGIPAASLGSVSISAVDPVSTVEEIISFVKHTTEAEVPKNFDELLRSYQGKELLIEMGQGKIKATILAIPPDTIEESLSGGVSSIAVSSTTSFLNPVTTPPVHLPSQLIALRIKDQSGESTLWINKASINSISVPGQEAIPQRNTEKKSGQLKYDSKAKISLLALSFVI